jgi:hypothetical protein
MQNILVFVGEVHQFFKKMFKGLNIIEFSEKISGERFIIIKLKRY